MASLSSFHNLPLANLNITPVSEPLSTDVSTLETVQQMSTLARANASYPAVRRAVDEALAGCDYNRATRRELATLIWGWIKRNIKFVQDENVLEQEFGVSPNNELLIEPSVLLGMEEPRGDCDDFSMLCAAMLLAAGLPAHYITIAADGHQPHRWSHVYTATTLEDGTDFPLDTSHGEYAGWEKNKPYRRQKWVVWHPEGLGEVMRNAEDRNVIGAGFPGMRGLGSAYGGEADTGGEVTGGGSGTDWSSVLNTAMNVGGRVATTMLAPGTTSGQYVIRNGMLYSTVPGQNSLLPTGSFSTTTVLLLGVAAVALIAVMGRGR